MLNSQNAFLFTERLKQKFAQAWQKKIVFGFVQYEFILIDTNICIITTD